MKKKEYRTYLPTLDTMICDFSLLLYLCVLYTHQVANTLEQVLRYGTLGFVVIIHFFFFLRLKHSYFFYISKQWTFALWLLLFIGYGAVSFLWSIQPSNVFNVATNMLKVAVVCIVTLPRFQSEKSIRRGLLLVIAALCYMLVVLVIKTPFSAWGTERIGSAIGVHSNDIGRLANLGILLCIYFLSSQKKHRLFLIIMILAFTVCVFMTGSKNAILILIFQVGLYFFMAFGKRKHLLIIVLTMVLGVLIIQVIMTNELLFKLVGIRFKRFFGLITGNDYDGSTYERLFFMETAWKLFKEEPLFGIGMNNFSSYLASIFYGNAKYSHSGFLELLSTLGITGFIIYYSMFVYVIIKLIKPAFKGNRLAAVLFTHISCIFIFDITTISVYTYYSQIMLLFTYCEVKTIQRNKQKGRELLAEIVQAYYKSNVKQRNAELSSGQVVSQIDVPRAYGSKIEFTESTNIQ